MPATDRKVFLVSHTHWDREWYLTFARFRVNLVDIVGGVLETLELDDDYRHFLLDGQAIILEDYLEAVPEDRERIAGLVRGGALSIGPWYILPDEFLVSGEATVRNLLIGHRVCREFGGAQKVGYMPDSFGHIAQMPQILRGAGIDSFVYTRGNGDEIDRLGQYYRWQAPDGSTVLAVNQWGGYCNAGGLGLEEIWHAHTRREVDVALAVAKVGKLLAEMEPRTPGTVFLLNNGCDHFPAQKDLGEILAALARACPGTEFLHTGLAEFLEAVREQDLPLETFTGELLGGRHHMILSGVWSARMPLKQQNDRAQELLAAYAEPCASYLFFAHGRDYPHGLLHAAWKELLKNHPHDSICGCSTDDVHRQMGPRFDLAIETAEQVVSRGIDQLCPMFARRAEDDFETVLTVLNPLPVRRTVVVERMVVLRPEQPGIGDLELRDETGAVVPFEVVTSHLVERFWGIDYRAELFAEAQHRAFGQYLVHFRDRILRTPDKRDESDRYVTIRFRAEDLPGTGHANYFLAPREGEPAEVPAEVTLDGHAVENGLVRVLVHGNGSFDLTDLRTGREYPGLNLLTDTGDVGDEYDYSPDPERAETTATGVPGGVSVVSATRQKATLAARFIFENPTVVAVSVTAGSPAVSVSVRIENQKRDHRLRAAFPTGIVSDSVWSDGHFLVNARPVDVDPGLHWVQPHPGTIPQQEFTLVEDAAGGLAVLNRGLPEMQATRGEEGVELHLTLLRSVGWLSRDDFKSRRFANAGPTLHTPDAQCLGVQRFSYAVVPFEGDWRSAGVPAISRDWRTPPVVRQGVRDLLIPGGRGLLEKSSSSTGITGIKRHEERDTLIVRLVNLTGEPATDTLTLGLPVRAAWRTNLLEEREEQRDAAPRLTGSTLSVDLAPHEIVTLEIEFDL